MNLQNEHRLSEVWNYALARGSRVVLMRHAPKSGLDGDLSEHGKMLAAAYGNILKNRVPGVLGARLVCTSKPRTLETLKSMFPESDPKNYLAPPELDVNRVSAFVQNQVNDAHRKTGHWLGYSLQMTYYYLERLGGQYDEENLRTIVTERMVNGIHTLCRHGGLTLYCGHSPAIELAAEKILGMQISEIGGFLNPLDSLHIRMNADGVIELVARTNPIIGLSEW